MLAAGRESGVRKKSGDSIQAYHSTRDLFEVSRRKLQLWITGADDGTNFEIPILPDMYGETALDVCLGITKTRKQQHNVFVQRKESVDGSNSLNYAMAEVIFMGISQYSFMHSSY